MAKISFALLFALVLALPLGSVLCQDDPWQSVIDQASQAVGDGSAQQAAEEAFGSAATLSNAATLADWVQQAKDMGSSNESPPDPRTEYSSLAEAPQGFPDDDDDVDDSRTGAPENSPTKAPELSPKYAPIEAPGSAPTNAPNEEPESASTTAPVGAPKFAPTNAPTQTPSAAPQAQASYAATTQA